MDTAATKNTYRLQWFGFFAGPIACLIALLILPASYAVPDSSSIEGPTASRGANQASTVEAISGSKQSEFPWAGRATLSVMIWMAIWWMTEAVEISVTALLPIAIFPVMGIAKIDATCYPYADPLVFLYFGGFVIALSMERWGLGRRVALMTLRAIGTSAPQMIAGFMIVTAVLSGFVSNTATTAMMLPIALSVIALVIKPQSSGTVAAETEHEPTNHANFATCLLLCIAYSASIGGIATIIGTPTNSFLVGFVRHQIAEPYRQDFTFLGWLPIGVPLVCCMLPTIYFLLTRWLFPIRGVSIEGGRKLIDDQLLKLGGLQRGELITLYVFFFTVALWLLRPLLTSMQISIDGTNWKPLGNLTDTGIAMIGAMLLFMIPVNVSKMQFTMDWATAQRMPWGILFLFGGGLSLAAAVQANGVAEFLGAQAGIFGSLPPFLIVLLVTTAIIFLTELTSNAATTASLVPVLAALAPGLGIHPYLLIFPATIAASCAFMLPVATPPNAIVFGSGKITTKQMMKAGFWLNLISIFLVTLIAMYFIKPWLGI